MFLFYLFYLFQMKKVIWFMTLLWVILLLSWCSAWYKDEKNPEVVSVMSGVMNTKSDMLMSEEQSSKLEYLLQEEKLARDVYLQMYKLWWNKKFYNIISSEENHQSQVTRLFEKYEIDNPIKELWIGEFWDNEFKNLYEQFIASGSISLANAFQVWVTIENTDINDIEETMKLFEGYPDVQQVLTVLLEWSKRHLAAFSR